MNFLELSIKNLEKVNKELYKKIIIDFDYDCVVFVARGSYMIGVDIAKYKKVPLLEIFAKRKGGKLKKILSPILSIIPNNLKVILRKKEFNSSYHEKNYERNVYFDKTIWKKYKDCKKILIVDDSVDTGYTIKYVKEKVQEFFSDSIVKVASINCFNKSKEVIDIDYYLYEDTMLKGPWSNDSKENRIYLKKYEEWHENQGALKNE